MIADKISDLNRILFACEPIQDICDNAEECHECKLNPYCKAYTKLLREVLKL